jgi:hypothetical protein
MKSWTLNGALGVAMVAGVLISSAVRAQTTEPVRISDSTGSSLAVRAEFISSVNEALWPEPRSLTPFYESWEIGISSLYGKTSRQLETGRRYVYDEGQLTGPKAVRAESALTMIHGARKWTGLLPNGDELQGFLGIGTVRMELVLDAGGADFLEPSRNAAGFVFGLGYRHDLTERSTLEARLGTFATNPLYFFGQHDFAAGLTNQAVFGELGVIWPRKSTVGLHVGIQGIRYVPRKEDAESVTDIRLWGPFLGIRAALK